MTPRSRTLIVLLTWTLAVVGLGTSVEASDIQAIEQAHAASRYEAHAVVQADMVIDFGPMHLEGTFWLSPSTGKVRMELDGGTTIVYDGQTAWLSPRDAVVPGPPARFHVLTWPYFFAAPYKLDDPGTHHAATGPHFVRNTDEPRHGTKITFGTDVGDTPEDWYIAFADSTSGRLSALAYIVTYDTALEEASKTPSIILYDDFVDVDGVPFATTWTFHFWNSESGIDDSPKGSAKISNIAFIEEPDSAFVKPDGAGEAAPPGP